MNVDVDLLPGDAEVQEEPRPHAVGDGRSVPPVGGANEVGTPKRTAVYEQVAASHSGPRRVGALDEAVDLDATVGAPHRDKRSPLLLAPDPRNTGGRVRRRGEIEERALVRGEVECHPGVGQGQGGRDLVDGTGLGAHRLQEACPGGRVEEEVSYVDGGSTTACDVRHVRDPSAHDVERRSRLVLTVPRIQAHTRDGCDGRDRLTPKTERSYARQILRRRDLARGVAVQAEERILSAHPDSIVGDADPALAPSLDPDLHPGRACVQSVLDELLDDGSGPLDRLSRSDLVGDGVRQHVDSSSHGRPMSRHIVEASGVLRGPGGDGLG